MEKTKSLELWEQYGEYIFMATTYKDQIITEGKDCIIRDLDGNEYLDVCSGQMCAILGHNHPKLIQRITETINKILHTGSSFLNPPVFEAAAKLADVVPGNLKKSIFLSTGAEANECAFRMAKAYTQKEGIIALTKGYAGLSLATLSATNYGKNASPLVPETHFILTPDCHNCPVNMEYPECDIFCLKVSKEMLKRACVKTAAIIVEPILSSGGLIVPPKDYFIILKEFADEIDALLIIDEAQTGFGRTGKWFGIEHYGIVPDILVFSKGTGGGFPASGVIINESIAKEINGNVRHFSSHQSDPVAAEAIATVIDIIKEENLVESAAQKGNYMMEKLGELSEKQPTIANIRGHGLMVGFDIFDNKNDNKNFYDLGNILEYACRERGVHLQCIQKNRFRIIPPLTITIQEIDHFIAVLEEAIKDTISGKYSPEDILSKNQYTRELEKMSNKTFTETLKKIWETSPSKWTSKVKEKIRT